MDRDRKDSTSLDAGAAQNASRSAKIFLFFANMMNHLPDGALIEELKEIHKAGFPDNLFQIGLSKSIRQGINEINHYLSKMSETSDKDIELQLAVDWTRLFRGVSKGYGPPPPYEGVYRSQDNIGVETIQVINNYYRKHDVGLENNIQNRPDYLGFEFDFVRHLFEAEAEAWDDGDQKSAVNFHMEGMRFLANHIEPWVPQFTKEALPYANTEFYKGFLRIMQGVIIDLFQVQDS